MEVTLSKSLIKLEENFITTEKDKKEKLSTKIQCPICCFDIPSKKELLPHLKGHKKILKDIDFVYT